MNKFKTDMVRLPGPDFSDLPNFVPEKFNSKVPREALVAIRDSHSKGETEHDVHVLRVIDNALEQEGVANGTN